MIVILGTAHLSSTAGKRSPDGKFREFAYSREICNSVLEELRARGIQCFIDFPDNDMYVKGRSATPSEELVQRVKIVNDFCKKYGTANCIYVSIHVNAASSKGWNIATGWEAYTSVGKTRSDALAECLYAAAAKNFPGKKLRTDRSDGDPDKECNFYVLKNTLCPAVLTENFFQDSKADVEYLLSEEGRKAVVDTHVQGILAYIGK